MAKGPLTVLAYSHDDKVRLDEGKLTLVNNEILQTTGTVQLKADFRISMSGPIFLRAATAANGLPLVEFGSSHCA